MLCQSTHRDLYGIQTHLLDPQYCRYTSPNLNPMIHVDNDLLCCFARDDAFSSNHNRNWTFMQHLHIITSSSDVTIHNYGRTVYGLQTLAKQTQRQDKKLESQVLWESVPEQRDRLPAKMCLWLIPRESNYSMACLCRSQWEDTAQVIRILKIVDFSSQGSQSQFMGSQPRDYSSLQSPRQQQLSQYNSLLNAAKVA